MVDSCRELVEVSRAFATIEFIMVRCRLLSIAELSLSCSDLAQCIFEVCT